MKRDAYKQLLGWRESARRKPLLLRGARQTGKTYLLKKLGREAYEGVVYCNFEQEPLLADLFAQSLKPARIVELLSTHVGRPIRPARDLIIFDEIQASNQALASLKYFAEEAGEHHVAAAGSLLGLKLSAPRSLTVGKVNFVDLYPMTFLEFLQGVGREAYRRHLEELEEIAPLPEVFHAELTGLLRTYHLVGGMPEAVRQLAATGELTEVRTVQDEILRSYVFDFAKHVRPAEAARLTRIWDSVPTHLARENKKLIFSAIHKSARAREYEEALVWLEDIGLIHRCFSVSTSKLPLRSYSDRNCFKVYCLDVGLLGALARAPLNLGTQSDRLFTEYAGALAENYVAQQLAAAYGTELYYWRSRGGRAELDFLHEQGGTIYPVEVKAGINPRSKSLRSFDDQFGPPLLLRSTLLNLKHDGRVCNIPLYAIGCLDRIIELAS